MNNSMMAHSDHEGDKPARLGASDLECMRGERHLFKNLSFQMEAGACLLVQGANGSGKTSLLRILAGLTPPSAGAVHWKGESIKQLGDEYRSELLYCGHQNALKEELTAEENLLSSAVLGGRRVNMEAVREALGQAGLAGRESLPVRVLSQGQRRRTSLARLLLDHRPIWILDEPLTALDTSAVRWLAGVIDQHLALGGLTVMTSHQDIPLTKGVLSMHLGL